jgi:hypothetical protein
MSPARLWTERATGRDGLRDIKPQPPNGNENLPPGLIPAFVELRTVMNNPDQDTIIRAVEDARRILGEYRGDATRTVERLLAVLDRSDVVHALDRIKRRKVIRLVE